MMGGASTRDGRTVDPLAPAPAPSGVGRQPQAEAEKAGRRDTARLLRQLFEAPRMGAGVLLSSLAINVLGVALPLAMLQIYDRILPNQSRDTLLYVGLGLVCVIIVETALRVARAYVVRHRATQEGFRASVRAAQRILATPARLLERHESTHHTERLESLNAIAEFHGGQSWLLMLDLPFIALYFAVIGYVGGSLVAVPLAVSLLFGIVTFRLTGPLRQALSVRADKDRRRYDFIIDVLSGIQTVKLMAMEPLMQRRFERLQETEAQASFTAIQLGNSAQTVSNLFANAAMASIVSVGAVMVVHGSMTVGALACCTLLAGRAVQPLLRGVGLLTELQNVTLHRQRAASLARFGSDSGVFAGADDLMVKGAIEIDKLSYGQTATAGAGIRDLSLSINPGEIVGITGSDSSGKSTLLKIILGQRSARSGRVLIDGIDVSGPDRERLRAHIGYVPQNAVLFSGTILENITMFKGGFANERAREAARLIGLEKDIQRLPEGYATRVGEGISETIAEGIAQRIVIARALVLRPAVLLFDEANAALDRRSDTLLRDGLSRIRGATTMILVSNRPSFLRLADRVFTFRDGKFLQVYFKHSTFKDRVLAGAGQAVSA